jgi:DNA helicase-2/ATP-dependent DNA helicase PcrA
MAELEVIFGPPGTGKTTTLTAVASEAIRTEGTDRLMVCAFTRTAAQELVGRGLEIEARQRGTLHAICFHGLDRPPLAEKQYAAWNAAYPLYALSSAQSSGNLDPDDPQRYDGDACLQELNNARHRLDAVSTLSPQATAFWQCWEHWKKDEGYLDFTDLLVYARRVLPIAPFVNAPYTLLVDEAQDLSLLQWAVLRQWARHATRFVAAGDDDQALYNWAAADVRPLLAASSRRVLPQSYRVPRAHQALALRYCAAIRIRQPKTWQPRGTEVS